jgi:hypothetical protein
MALRVAAIGWRNRQIVIVVYVAKRAGHIRMAVGQQESRGTVVEFGVQPVIERMATRAVGSRKRGSRGWMFGVCSSQPIRHMAGGASSGKPHEISNRGVLVAGVALHHGMSAQKREAIKVILNRLIGNLPTENRVALRAIGSHLRAVNICMAVGAIFTNFRK